MNIIISMKKHIAVVVLAIVIGLCGNAVAKVKIYKSNSDLPFVEMMLGMMVAMGILDKIPPEFIGLNRYGSSPYGYNNLSYRDRIKQYLARRHLANRYPGGIYPGSRYPGYGVSYPVSRGLYPNRYGVGTAPFYQNPMSGFPSSSPFGHSRNYNRHDSWQPMRPSTCVGGSCLARSSNSLNGLWVGDDGEMLGIKNDQFFWTDGQELHMSGLMNVSDDHVVANIDGSNEQISYDYRVQGNELLTRDEGGVIRVFWRYQPIPPVY